MNQVEIEKEINAVLKFVQSHENKNAENCLNNKPYLSVSCFMLDYCKNLRSKITNKQSD